MRPDRADSIAANAMRWLSKLSAALTDGDEPVEMARRKSWNSGRSPPP